MKKALGTRITDRREEWHEKIYDPQPVKKQTWIQKLWQLLKKLIS